MFRGIQLPVEYLASLLFLLPFRDVAAQTLENTLDSPLQNVSSLLTSSSSRFYSDVYIRVPCYAVIFILGVTGNTLVIVTLARNRKMRTVTNVFLLNLAVSDLLLGVFCMPFTLIGSLLRDFIFGDLLCRLIQFFQAVSVSVSVWTLVAISLERHYAICHPLRSRGWQTLSHAYKIISLIWALSLTVLLPTAFLSQLKPIGNTDRHKCREEWPSQFLERSFAIFLTFFLLLLPLVVMAVAYASISFYLWHGIQLERQAAGKVISLTDVNGLNLVQRSLLRKEAKKNSKIAIQFRKIPCQPSLSYHDDGTTEAETLSLRPSSPSNSSTLDQKPMETWGEVRPRLRSTHAERSIKAKRRVIRMLFVVVLEFFLCWTPIFAINLIHLFIPGQVYSVIGVAGVSYFHLLAYTSSCCNPITYCFMNRKFLQGFRHAFGCTKESEALHLERAGSCKSNSNYLTRFAAVDFKNKVKETTI